MRRSIPLTVGLILIAASPSGARTFDRTPIAPGLGVDALTRGVARQQLGRDLFSNPYATVTIGNTDVYDVFPYAETRTFQIVSDSRWNRLVYGEQGRSLRAYDGAGRPFGPLSNPRGMAVDEENHVYVADAGNNRVLVMRADTEFGDIELVPMFEIAGLGDPQGVAYSDGGTPFVHGDDLLYVADTGRNRVVAFALEADGARQVATLGELGSGPGRFAGPMAIAVGRTGGANTRDVYVADAHTRRIVHLRHETGGFQWIADRTHDADVVTSLETDRWGNLFAAAPHQGLVRKFNAALEPVAELRGQIASPRSFHLPFFTLRDHRDGRVERNGQPNGLSIDSWTDATGVNLWSLGLEVNDFAVEPGPASAARFALTDRADVTLELVDAATGRSLWKRPAGALEAGEHTLALGPAELQSAASASVPMLRLLAVSSYPSGPSAVAQTRLQGSGVAALPKQPVLLGNSPNPVKPFTRISFALPAGATGASLRVFDANGRLVRGFARDFSPGLNEVLWDGTDDRGQRARAGVYFYRLEAAGLAFSRKMVLVR